MDLPKFLVMVEQRSLYFALLEEFDDKWEAVISRDLSHGIQSVFGAASGTAIRSYQEICEYIGINCWYGGRDESIAMWKLYTRCDYGVAIKSTVGHLKRALQNTKEIVLIGKVEYRDHTEAPSEVLSVGRVSPFNAILQKRTCYKHESEIRAMTQITEERAHRGSDAVSPVVNSAPLTRRGVALPVDLSILIRSVTTGPNFPRLAYPLLTTAISRAALDIEIIESNVFKAPEVRHFEP